MFCPVFENLSKEMSVCVLLNIPDKLQTLYHFSTVKSPRGTFVFFLKKISKCALIGDENRAIFRGFKFTPCRQNLVNSSALGSSIRSKSTTFSRAFALRRKSEQKLHSSWLIIETTSSLFASRL